MTKFLGRLDESHPSNDGDADRVDLPYVEKFVTIRGHRVRIRRFEDPTPVRTRRPRPARQHTSSSSGAAASKGRSRSQAPHSEHPSGQRRPAARPPRSEELPPISTVTPLPPAGDRQLLIRAADADTIQAVLLEGPLVTNHFVASTDSVSLVNNIYMGRVASVVPALEAAFVDIGFGPHGIVRPSSGVKNLKEGQPLVVQVVADAFGRKGPKLRTELVLPGRYLVLLPFSPDRYSTSRLPANTPESVRAALAEVKPATFGMIARANAATASPESLARDRDRLVGIWGRVLSAAPAEALPDLPISVSAHGNLPQGDDWKPFPLWESPSLPIQVAEEFFVDGWKRLVTDSPKIAAEVRAYLSEVDPHLVRRVQVHDDPNVDLFSRFHVFDQLRKAIDRRVYLPSGGSIVIDRAEALTAIDVNSGRFSADSESHAQTVLATNKEAAIEIARQLRLRDIGGLVVVDFIDMPNPAHRAEVMTVFRRALAADDTAIETLPMSSLGLVELSRRRRSAGILAAVSSECPHCNGRGVLVSENILTTPTTGQGEQKAS